ncbi:hypothetical protein GQ54DRAFT_314721 [Martensiomyces pterosporus]|nr:hypothetical protein GQ54DRAFT_314721 [Martensiomyces pterosporus]
MASVASEPLLDISYSRRRLHWQLGAVDEWIKELEDLESEARVGTKESIIREADLEDIGVASFHGTSTSANFKNESEVFNRLMGNLGRTPKLTVSAACLK